MIKFACPECKTTIEVEDRYAGQVGKCQTCGGAITVPQPEVPMVTGLDALRGMPDVPPENFGAYGKAADAHWVDPTAIAEEVAKKKAEEPPVALPDIPAEILAAAQARKKQTIKYVIGAALAALVVMLLLLPLLAPASKPAEAPKEAAPVPKFVVKEVQ